MSNRKQLVILNVVAILFFVSCWIWLGFELSDEAMFYTSDSKDYLEVINWLFRGEETVFTITRPVLFPMLIGLPYLIFGSIGIWVFQFICWLITINLTFLSIKKWTGKSSIAWGGAGVVVINLSFIALTFVCLTEVVTTALLSMLCYHVVSSSKKFDNARFGQRLLFLFVLLTLVKPLFYYPTLLCFVFILFAYRKHYFKNFRKLMYPVIIVIPILLQMILVQIRHDSFAVSKIGGLTFTKYYFSQCVRSIEQIEDTEKSVEFSKNLSSDERVDYMLEHKGVFVTQFVENVVLNIKSEPVFLDSKYVKKQNSGYTFMIYYNQATLLIHVVGIMILVFLFLRSFIKRDKELWIPLLCIGGLSGYFLFTTGLSFWQGDRLVLPSIALWVPLYAALFMMVVSKLRTNRKSSE